VSRSALVVVVAAGEFGAEVEEAPRAREIEIRDPDGSRVRDAHGSWTGATRNFLELRLREVRGTSLPGHWVNREGTGAPRDPCRLRALLVVARQPCPYVEQHERVSHQ
jgi:hypothetical protein